MSTPVDVVRVPLPLFVVLELEDVGPVLAVEFPSVVVLEETVGGAMVELRVDIWLVVLLKEVVEMGGAAEVDPLAKVVRPVVTLMVLEVTTGVPVVMETVATDVTSTLTIDSKQKSLLESYYCERACLHF